MKSAMFEMLEMINNRSDNSLKTKFNEEEKNFWLEKEKQQIIDTYTAGEIRPYNGNKYYNSTFGDSKETENLKNYKKLISNETSGAMKDFIEQKELKKIAFDFYYDMSKKMNVPENLISKNETNFDGWFEKRKIH